MEKNIHPARHKEAGHRSRRVIIKMTIEEHQLLQNRSEKAGLYMAAYIRQIVFKGKITPRLSEEEKELFKALVILSNALHESVKLAREQGMEVQLTAMADHGSQIDKLLKKFKV